MKYKHYFWDYDGTLFDTYPCVTRDFLKGLEDLGITVSCEALYALEKVSLRHAAQVLGEANGVTPSEVMARYKSHFLSEGYAAMQPYPGVRELLEASYAKGARHYLYTHRDKSGVEALRYHHLDHMFTDFITSEDHFPSKPAPDALSHLIRKHNLRQQECVMLGDRDIDVQAGMNVEMAGVLLDPDNFYPAFQADYRFQTMEAIRTALVDT